MSAVDLLASIIRKHAPEDIWQDSPLIGYRMLDNTNRGEIGAEFIRRYLAQNSIHAGNGGRTSKTDPAASGGSRRPPVRRRVNPAGASGRSPQGGRTSTASVPRPPTSPGLRRLRFPGRTAPKPTHRYRLCAVSGSAAWGMIG